MRRFLSVRSIVTLFALVAAFGAGMAITSLGDGGDTAPASTAPIPESDTREVYSASLRSDPYYLGEQKRNVEALERHCADSEDMCAEARAARLAYEKLRNES
jgi:hypothetical protein